jgi:hypothetical protein
MNFSDVKSITIPEGKVKRITVNGVTLWESTNTTARLGVAILGIMKLGSEK